MSPLKMFEYLGAQWAREVSDLPSSERYSIDHISVLADPEDIDTWCPVIRHIAKDPQWGLSRSTAARFFAAQHSGRARTRRCIPLP